LGIEFRILGSLEVLREGQALPLGTRMQRALLAALLLRANEVTSTDRLIEDLWPDHAPTTALKTLRAYVSRLRRALDDSGSQLRTVGSGYRLEVARDALDSDRFEHLLDDARRTADSVEASELLADALGLWRGPVLADLAYQPFAQAEITRLEELRLLALEERIEADLELGRHAQVVGEIRSLVGEHPFRERLWAALMLALYRCGRQAEALEVYREARTSLVEELGLEPGPALQEVEAAILRQDTSLQAAAADTAKAQAAERTEPHEPARPPSEVRKTVTVVFGDVAGSTSLGERHDPEALRQALTRYFDVAAEAFQGNGGTVEKFIGDAVMAVFGIPALHEDDALRAVRAAWELARRLPLLNDELEAAYGIRLEIRVGINTGEVVAGGGSTDQKLVTGDPVNTAARLQQAADPGMILIGESTYRLVAGAVRAEPLDPMALPGKSDLVRAFSVVDVVAGAPSFVRRLEAPLVGRRSELAQLRQAFDRSAREQEGVLFTVIGPPGIGKTRLALQFERALSGVAKVLTGRCLSYGEGITYWPIREVLDAAFEGDPIGGIERLLKGDPDVGAVVDTTAAALGSSGETSTTEEVVWALRKVFEALARDAPLVVVFEDIHWGEPTFLDLVDRVADLVSGAPVMVLCLARPELLDARPAWGGGKLNAATTLLEPLTDDESALLLRRLATLDERTTAAILRTAEGNPLFIEQLLAAATEVGSTGDLHIPPTVEGLLAARIDRLAPEERAVIERAAVVGKEFEAGSVEDLLPDEPTGAVAERLESLVRKQFVRRERSAAGGGRAFAFRHVLIQLVAYEAIPKRRRADLHERLAGWIERRSRDELADVEEILAYHLEQACRCRRELGSTDRGTQALAERAIGLLAACGRRAIARGDAAGAVSLLSRAVALLDGAPRPEGRSMLEAAAPIMLDRGRAFGRIGDVGAGRADLEAVLEEARRVGDRDLEMHATNELGFLLAGAADYRAAVPHLETALEIAAMQGDGPGQVSALSRLAIVHVNRLDFEAGLEHGRRSLALAESLGDERAEAMAMDALKQAALQTGDFDTLDRLVERLIGIHRQNDDLWYLQFALADGATADTLRGRHDRALGRFHEAVAINRRIGDRGNEPMILTGIAWVHRAQGDYGAAVAEGQRALELGRALDHAEWIAWCGLSLASTLVELEAVKEAGAVLRTATEGAERAGADMHLARGLGLGAYASWRSGEPEKAAQLADRAETMIDRIRVQPPRGFILGADAIVALARVRIEQGRSEAAEGPLRRIVEASEACGTTAAAVDGRAAQAELALQAGEVEAALEEASRAVGQADEGGMPTAWRARAVLAQALLAAREQERAAEEAERAGAQVAALARTIDDARIRTAFEAGAAEWLSAGGRAR
jgi:DNA-binding SARP family transcriptional activator